MLGENWFKGGKNVYYFTITFIPTMVSCEMKI